MSGPAFCAPQWAQPCQGCGKDDPPLHTFKDGRYLCRACAEPAPEPTLPAGAVIRCEACQGLCFPPDADDRASADDPAYFGPRWRPVRFGSRVPVLVLYCGPECDPGPDTISKRRVWR